tara:strand:- start:872 stop:1474 length:603 start_codon:yes stop_codon:yes gene_type:complete
MKELIDNINQMTNPELIGLAKNRYLPEEVQVAITKTGYDRAAIYLCENIGLKPKARDILWNLGGYVKKCTLLSYGHYMDQSSKYTELYDQYATTIRNRSPWRISRTFLNATRWWGHGYCETTSNTGCPPEIIEAIYKQDVLAKREGNRTSSFEYGSQPGYMERYIIRNPNTPIDIIVKISASSPDDQVRNEAMQKMANRA